MGLIPGPVGYTLSVTAGPGISRKLQAASAKPQA
tara:strand:+ start:249 stop:350 length:102 start_codon:yes stop_codon:yes gene_type:complete